jgi:hypothetical protein
MLVISITNDLPPQVSGVGDYSLSLARQLWQDFGIETHFVVGNPAWKGGTNIEGFPVSVVQQRSAKHLLSLLPTDSTPILLHYSSYGYAKQGCAFWLVEGIERWKSLNTGGLLVTMFHEVYAIERSPWNTLFWLSLLHKNLATRLAKLSDRCLTSIEDHVQILARLKLKPLTPISALPVFSNIGEPQSILPLVERERNLVLFGSSGRRRRAYQECADRISLACQVLEIKQVIDIGPSTGLKLKEINGTPVLEMGHRSPIEVSKILSNSLAGFLNYNIKRLGKSTIFATYCSHGMLPVSPTSGLSSFDGIQSRKHYWISEPSSRVFSDSELQAIANNAYGWYQSHKLSVQAQVFAAYLNREAELSNQS